MRGEDAHRASGTRWFDQPAGELPVPPGETSDLAWDGRGVTAPTIAPDAGPIEDARSGQVDRHGELGSPTRYGYRTSGQPDPGREGWLRIAVDVVVVGFCALFVFLQMGPGNLVADTTPAGGDMGAHVWGPAYLRDHLLPNFQLAGWAPDWYSGFPAYQFYMVVPSLLIVLLDLGIEGPLAALPLGIAVGSLVYAGLLWSERRRRIVLLAVAGVALCCIGLPYGVAFKLVSVSGVISLPIAVYAFGRLSGLQFPSPAVLAAATLPFLFYRGFSIYGGNIASTLAGEFAFSMSLSVAFLYLGVLFKGFETGRYRALAAVLLALTGLCHLIPAIWAVGATVVALVVHPRRPRVDLAELRSALMAAGMVAAGALATLAGGLLGVNALLGLGGVLILAGGLAIAWLVLSQSLRWLAPVAVVGSLLSAFWVVPFVLRREFLNDMGWEKLPYPDPETGELDWWQHLFPSKSPDVDLRIFFVLAVVGFGLSLGLRLRVGIFLGLAAIANGFAFWLLPQGRLWNARVLPFYYLVVILLAALAIVETVRLIAELVQPWRRTPSIRLGAATAVGTLAAILLYVGLPLGVLPLSDKLDQGGYAWPNFSPMKFESSPESFVKGWANWNYTGYEGKDSYREYYDIVSTMDRLGKERECGMAFWEYQKELDRYGTPMALMLLPYWTDGCIGSMEGLYFEASATTPYHFLMQTELSTAPSAAQRDMPYAGFDINRGVQHMQLMGVRYYMATTAQAIQAASIHPDLTQVARSGPWVVYEVAKAETVVGLSAEPAVIDGVPAGQKGWMHEPRDATDRFFGPSIQWFNDPQRWETALAADGPEAWQRIGVRDGLLEQPDGRSVAQAEVSNIDMGRESISFDVDRVGSPVLVKESYFPNWKVDGALGPYRVAPNLMVVVPTERHVRLHYGSTPVEWLAWGLTLAGVAGLVLLYRRGPYRFSERGPTTAMVGEPALPVVPYPTLDATDDRDRTDSAGGSDPTVADPLLDDLPPPRQPPDLQG